MLTDYHCHVLPGIDDGAETPEISGKMLDLMKMQGVGRVILTPHFYPHRERSVESFLDRRANAFAKISHRTEFEFHLGAEVAIEHGISEIPGIEQLAVEGTYLMLLELPFSGYGRWVLDEIHNLKCAGIVPVLAHIHRYIGIYSKSQLDEILNTDAIFQVNTETFAGFRESGFVKKLIRSSAKVVFGSNAHNLADRKPNFDLLKRKVKAEVIGGSDAMFREHCVLRSHEEVCSSFDF